MKNRDKANLGIEFEQLIITANNYYLLKNIAAIIKVPTSFKIVRKYDPIRKRSEIISAYPEEKSTVDFTGQLQNKPVWFEAKSTSNKTSFPLSKIADHQLRWLDAVDELGGSAFILFELVQLRSYYRMDYKQLKRFIAAHDRKSIPFDFFKNECYEIKFNQYGILDYLRHFKIERGFNA
jgi:recombination protein U